MSRALARVAALPSLHDALALRLVVAASASRWAIGSLRVRLPGGEERIFGTPGATPVGTIEVHDPSFFGRLLLRGEVGFGEAFTEGLWSSPDLVGLLRACAINRRALAADRGWWRLPARLLDRRWHLGRRNTVSRSRENITAHYDLGNDFYRLFLDPTMTYSGAVFGSEDPSLEEAQVEKYRRIARLAGIERGSHVLEIGTGWGGFAVHAAEELGCRVTTITISEAQRELALARVRDRGLSARIEVQLCDYREVEGQYDAVVSIEMLEAVGSEYYGSFFATCDRALRPGGRIGLQVITVPDRAYETQRRGVNWVQRYIFPGGLLPSRAAIERALAGTDLSITSADDIGQDYARTLRAWRERFLARRDEVRALGLGDRFQRMWEYYLALCEAGFATGVTQNLQIGLAKPAMAAERMVG